MKLTSPKTVVDPDTGELLDQQSSHINKNHDANSERARLRAVYLNDFGQEQPDPRPVSPPLGYKRQPSIFDLQREQIALHHRLFAEDREFETFEESEDFDIDGDVDPTSPWENDFDPPMSEIRQAIEADKAVRAAAAAPPSPDPLKPASAAPTVPASPPVVDPQDKS